VICPSIAVVLLDAGNDTAKETLAAWAPAASITPAMKVAMRANTLIRFPSSNCWEFGGHAWSAQSAGRRLFTFSIYNPNTNLYDGRSMT